MSNCNQTNYLKVKIESQEPVIGTWSTLASPLVTEVMARSGFDFETSKKVMDLEKDEYLKIINLL